MSSNKQYDGCKQPAPASSIKTKISSLLRPLSKLRLSQKQRRRVVDSSAEQQQQQSQQQQLVTNGNLSRDSNSASNKIKDCINDNDDDDCRNVVFERFAERLNSDVSIHVGAGFNQSANSNACLKQSNNNKQQQNTISESKFSRIKRALRKRLTRRVPAIIVDLYRRLRATRRKFSDRIANIDDDDNQQVCIDIHKLRSSKDSSCSQSTATKCYELTSNVDFQLKPLIHCQPSTSNNSDNNSNESNSSSNINRSSGGARAHQHELSVERAPINANLLAPRLSLQSGLSGHASRPRSLAGHRVVEHVDSNASVAHSYSQQQQQQLQTHAQEYKQQQQQQWQHLTQLECGVVANAHATATNGLSRLKRSRVVDFARVLNSPSFENNPTDDARAELNISSVENEQIYINENNARQQNINNNDDEDDDYNDEYTVSVSSPTSSVSNLSGSSSSSMQSAIPSSSSSIAVDDSTELSSRFRRPSDTNSSFNSYCNQSAPIDLDATSSKFNFSSNNNNNNYINRRLNSDYHINNHNINNNNYNYNHHYDHYEYNSNNNINFNNNSHHNYSQRSAATHNVRQLRTSSSYHNYFNVEPDCRSSNNGNNFESSSAASLTSATVAANSWLANCNQRYSNSSAHASSNLTNTTNNNNNNNHYRAHYSLPYSQSVHSHLSLNTGINYNVAHQQTAKINNCCPDVNDIRLQQFYWQHQQQQRQHLNKQLNDNNSNQQHKEPLCSLPVDSTNKHLTFEELANDVRTQSSNYNSIESFKRFNHNRRLPPPPPPIRSVSFVTNRRMFASALQRLNYGQQDGTNAMALNETYLLANSAKMRQLASSIVTIGSGQYNRTTTSSSNSRNSNRNGNSCSEETAYRATKHRQSTNSLREIKLDRHQLNSVSAVNIIPSTSSSSASSTSSSVSKKISVGDNGIQQYDYQSREQQQNQNQQRVVIQATTSELLQCLCNFLFVKCSKLEFFKPSVAYGWLRDVDRALLTQGWQDSAFINPANIVFLYMLLRSLVSEDIESIDELQLVVMTALYMSYSYMGNEISYPVQPFICQQDRHDRFWDRTLFIIDTMSGFMLKLNADAAYFAEVFTELKNCQLNLETVKSVYSRQPLTVANFITNCQPNILETANSNLNNNHHQDNYDFSKHVNTSRINSEHRQVIELDEFIGNHQIQRKASTDEEMSAKRRRKTKKFCASDDHEENNNNCVDMSKPVNMMQRASII